jgi:hypothetical protein
MRTAGVALLALASTACDGHGFGSHGSGELSRLPPGDCDHGFLSATTSAGASSVMTYCYVMVVDRYCAAIGKRLAGSGALVSLLASVETPHSHMAS